MLNKFLKIIFISVIAFVTINTNLYSQWTKVVVAVTGTVVDEITKKPLTVDIAVFDNTGKKFNSTKSNAGENGYYYITGLVPGTVYIFEISSDSYLSEKRSFSIPNSDKYLEISKDFSMKPKMMDAHIPFAVSPFEFNKSKIRYGASSALEGISSTLKSNPNVKFTILSYPDNNTNKDQNSSLTKQRADAIFDYFVINGIDPSRMSIKQSTSVDPKMPPPTEKRAKGKKYIGTTYIVINSL
jgi:outer membrane protein OmpA-like peptidoglycan-associated protein